MTYDTKGIWRCYEIKVSKADFYSKAKKTFVGHFNYLVMTNELFEEVNADIPNHVGVYIGGVSVKRAKKQVLTVDEQILKDSLIRSLSRDVEKMVKSNDPDYVNRMNRMINNERKDKERYREQYWELLRKVQEKHGTTWEIS